MPSLRATGPNPKSDPDPIPEPEACAWPGAEYASQKVVYENLGAPMLKNALEGYNCTMFAYGQTGAGKSYSFVGYGVNKGILPIVSTEIFAKVRAEQSDNHVFQIGCSYMEIYGRGPGWQEWWPPERCHGISLRRAWRAWRARLAWAWLQGIRPLDAWRVARHCSAAVAL